MQNSAVAEVFRDPAPGNPFARHTADPVRSRPLTECRSLLWFAQSSPPFSDTLSWSPFA